MTAPRTCRACGTALSPDVRWCLRCYEPVRELAPRAPQLPPLPSVFEPKHESEMSRWKAGATTFGPVGRLVVTGIVVLMAPGSRDVMSLVIMWPCYLLLAGVVLRSTWRRDYVDTTGDARRAPEPSTAPSGEPVRTPLPRATVVAWALLGALGAGTAIVWTASGHVGRGIIGIAASAAALVLMMRWSIRG